MKKSEKITAGIVAAGAALLLLKGAKGTSGVGGTTEHVVAKVVSTKYRNTSSYGNPSYWVTLETADGKILRGYTGPNYSIGYEIQNGYLEREYNNWEYTVGSKGLIIKGYDKL